VWPKFSQRVTPGFLRRYDRARSLFSTKGYSSTTTEDIISDLGLTRGALYYQFKDKLGVFKAVIAEAYDEITHHIKTKTHDTDDNWHLLILGCQSFLEVAQQEELRRLVFIEAPAVLPAETLAEFDQHGFGLLYEVIESAIEQGQINTIDAEGFAHLLNGSLNELAAWVAKSSDPKRLHTAQLLVESLLTHYRS
ncbi:TetR/AcrR family transcriptional regulator, partial [Crocosphaera sp. Alani8]|uniref:TetR/AcrR family transcriptional regulator n=1 Tax=Crocosphaera sp. Alani8 TaxID=3038952 RepID=UPI00313C2B70